MRGLRGVGIQGLANPVFSVGCPGGAIDYQGKIETLFSGNIAGYWPMNDASGTVCDDKSVNNKDLTYSGVQLGHPGIGDGYICPYFDGLNDKVSSGWAQLVSVLNITEGAILVWIKMFDVNEWNGSNSAGIVEMSTFGGTTFLFQKTTIADIIKMGTSTILVPTETDWIHMGITWSAAAGKLIGYIHGDPINDGEAFTTLSAFITNGFVVGGGWNSSMFFKGWMAHVILLNRAPTPGEMIQAASLPEIDASASYSGSSAYSTKIATTFGANLIGHWPFNESRGRLLHNLVAGTSSGINSPYGISFNSAGIGDGLTSTSFDRSLTAYINCQPLAGYSGDEGSIMIWGKVANSDSWLAANDAYLFFVSNQVGGKFGLKTWNADHTFGVYLGGAGDIYGSVTPTLDWFHCAFTWSKADNQTKLYFNGVQLGATGTCGGGLAIPLQIITFGKLQTSQYWNGQLAHAVFLNRAATPAEIAIAAVA